VEIPEVAREFQPPKPLYNDTSVYKKGKTDIVIKECGPCLGKSPYLADS
jgi:hypothetical protein